MKKPAKMSRCIKQWDGILKLPRRDSSLFQRFKWGQVKPEVTFISVITREIIGPKVVVRKAKHF
jgi:hypothetical protein